MASQLAIPTVWDRFDAQKSQCRFGREGLCCRNCFMGPCRATPGGKGASQGICGATADTIVARNLLRHIASGTAAHSDHGREIVRALRLAAEGKSEVYKIRGTAKLQALAKEYGVATEDRSSQQVALELADLLLAEFGKQDGELHNNRRAPEQQQK
ncbi:MAG: hypothetical protein ACYC6Y_27270, partial [Thermoguttaceae bacterium]